MADPPAMSHVTDEDRTTAIGLARYAYEYLEAAILVDQTIGQSPGFERVSPIPAYFLALHSIELSLKAYLRHHGVSVRDLRSGRRFGHDISACYRKAKELGLCDCFKIREDDTRAMKMLIDMNVDQALRYIKTGFRRSPSWAIVEPFAVRLHQAVAPHVGYRKTFDIFYPTMSRRGRPRPRAFLACRTAR